jgi:hypothetical protein
MEVRFARKWASVEELAWYDPFNEDDFELCLENIFDEGDLSYEDIVALELVELDSTGIINLDADSNPHREFDYDVFWEEIDDSTGTALLVYHDKLGTMRWCFDHDEYPYIDRDNGKFDKNFMPSFSSRNRTNVGVVHCYSDHFTWPHRNYGRKQAKWRDENGKRGRKDPNFRWSRRHMQMQMFEQFYVAYTPEQYLDDNARVMMH